MLLSSFIRGKLWEIAILACSVWVMFSSGDVPKKKEVFGDLPGTDIYFDEVTLLLRKTVQEYDKNLGLVFERDLKYDVKFNPDKIQFKQSSVKFMGQIGYF